MATFYWAEQRRDERSPWTRISTPTPNRPEAAKVAADAAKFHREMLELAMNRRLQPHEYGRLSECRVASADIDIAARAAEGGRDE